MDENYFLDYLSESVKEIHKGILKLYSCNCNKQKVLDDLSNRLNLIERYIIRYRSQANEMSERVLGVSSSPAVQVDNDLKTFTQEELAKYDGLNGNPAYIAVNGVVYNLTNIPTWAAATHFGLTPGKDLTPQYTTCHAGANILNTLPVVGRLVN